MRLARRHEDERITENIRDALPDRITALGRFTDWKPEREWIPLLMETIGEPRKISMKLDVHEGNVGTLEHSSCEEIVSEQARIYLEGYSRIPSLEELCTQCGDPEGRRVYLLPRDLKQKWMDMHAAETGTPIPPD
jgi:hypothetical protein